MAKLDPDVDTSDKVPARSWSAVAALVERGQILAASSGRHEAAKFLLANGVRFPVIIRVLADGPSRARKALLRN